MNSEITTQGSIEVTVKIRVDQSALELMLSQTYDSLRRQVKVAGFRPGKAPNNIVERELGSATIQNEVLEGAVKAGYAAAVQEHALAVIASPEINIIKFVPYTELEFTAQVPVMPTIKIPDLTKLKAERQSVKINDKEVERVIVDLQRRLADRKSVEQPASSGDEVNIDFEGFKGDKAISGASSKSYDLVLGSDSFIPGFELELVGLKAGDTKEFDITFPQDYTSSDLAGQKLRFKVKVNQVSQIELPLVDAEFVKKISPASSVEELRSDIKNRITDEKTESVQRQFENAVLDELLSATSFEVPPVLLDQQMTKLRADLQTKLASEGLDLDKYAQMQDKTLGQLDSEIQPEAAKRVKLAVLLTEVAKTEDLSVTLDEIESELTRLKALYPDPQMQAELLEPSTKEELYNHLLATKTVDRILQKVEGT